MKLVSVVICTNRVDDLFYRALDSLIKQSYENFEVILIGNSLSSEDKENITAIASRYSVIKLFITDVGCLTFSLNFGLHQSQGSLIARMDADDISHPLRLEMQVKYMEVNPSVDVCGSAFDLIDVNDEVIGECSFPITDEAIKNSLFWSNPFAHPTVMFKRDVIMYLGGYMGGVHAEDYDLWCRMKLSPSVKFANLPDKLLGYRATPTGLARKSKFAYSGVSASQWRCFVLTGDVRWLAAAILTAAKRVFFQLFSRS
jgi:glycosyltransferase involved in cell wall biosynthesis